MTNPDGTTAGIESSSSHPPKTDQRDNNDGYSAELLRADDGCGGDDGCDDGEAAAP